MKCMKCGTSITTDQVFCDSCQEEMSRYPVKPGTPIQLPKRTEKVVAKSGHKKIRKPEETIANLRALIFWLLLLIVALATALAITITLLLESQNPVTTAEFLAIASTCQNL